MFYNFNVHRQIRASRGEPRPARTEAGSSDREARKIVCRVLRMQRRWAAFMTQQTQKLPVSHLKFLCLTTGLAAGVFCFFLIMASPSVRAPDFGELSTISVHSSGFSQKRDLTQKLAFEAYLDSLQKDLIRDSINHLQTLNK